MKRARSLRLRLEHMLQGIARIEHLSAGRTVADYLADEDFREMIERYRPHLRSSALCPERDTIEIS